MGRSRMYAQAARRAALALNRMPRHRDETTAPGRTLFPCPYCGWVLKSMGGRDLHIWLRPYCRSRHKEFLRGKPNKRHRRRRKRKRDSNESSEVEGEPTAKQRRSDPSVLPEQPLPMQVDPGLSMRPEPGPSVWPRPVPSTAQSGGESEELPDNDRTCGLPFIEPFPLSTAGAPISPETKDQMDLREYLKTCGPLADPKLFETAELLMTTGLSGKARTKHLKSSHYKGKTPWHNNRALLKDLDRLPRGVKWVPDEVEVGEGADNRIHVVFKRDIVEVVRELISARRFKSFMRYAPERHWTSSRRRSRVYDEMWSGDWWWRTQYLIRDPSGTIVPLIISSDKTMLTRMSGRGQSAYPVYLTIGNISKDIRRKPTKHATTVIGYLPVDSFEDVMNLRTRQIYRGELLHRAMDKIVEPLKSTANGVPMWCADGRLRRVYPILAAYVADSPEQYDVSGVRKSTCVMCKQKFKGRGEYPHNAPLRDQSEMLQAMRLYQETKKPKHLDAQSLRPVWPFWADLPYSEFPSCFTPDLLHQVHKGLIKRHAMTWIEEWMGPKDFNARYMAMPRARDMRHFKRGITTVSRWTGRESKEMAKQLMSVVIDPMIPDDVVKLIRALLDFTYLSHSARLTEAELDEMQTAWAEFHRLKPILVEYEILLPGAWDHMPILHMVGHYTYMIQQMGTPDGYNTETPEYLHIPFVKNGWKASNKRDPIPQIVSYVGRMEAIRIHTALLDELHLYSRPSGLEGDIYDSDDEDEEDWGGGGEGYESEDSEDSEGDLDRTKQILGMDEEPEDSGIAYPRPFWSLGLHPTISHVRGNTLIDKYGASDLLQALRRFLRSWCQVASDSHHLLPSDRFDVWHKLTLHHHCLPFAPDEPPQRDVIRVTPPVYDNAGRLRNSGVFDVALFMDDETATGIQRYRAGRVRAIFTLPNHLKQLYPKPLALVELFTPFHRDITATHGMYTTMPSLSSASSRRTVVVPIDRFAMACHLAPRFPNMQPVVIRGRQTIFNVFDHHPDFLANSRHFFLNEFYNHFTYLFIMYWRHLRRRVGGGSEA